MISFTSRQKYYFYSGPMDMRKDIDTLSEVVRSQMGLDPYIEESVFIFMSKNLRTMKILYRGRRRFELTKIRLDDENSFCLYSTNSVPATKFAGATSLRLQRVFKSLKCR